MSFSQKSPRVFPIGDNITDDGEERIDRTGEDGTELVVPLPIILSK